MSNAARFADRVADARADASDHADGCWELQVLDGRAQGARARLSIGRTVLVGYDLGNDLVIRDPTARGVRLRLTPFATAARLEVLEGQVELLAHCLAAPATGILPPYTPLRLGASIVAFGESDAEGWRYAERLARAVGVDLDMIEEPDVPDADPLTDVPSGGWRALLGRANGRLGAVHPGVFVSGLSVILLLALGVGVVQPALVHGPSRTRAEALLRRDGFSSVRVSNATDGGLIATGLLEDEASRERLQSLVLKHNWPMTVNVQTNDGIARSVEDVFRTNGFIAKAQAEGPGAVNLTVSGGDIIKVDEVRAAALRDIAGLKVLSVNHGGGGALTAEDPGKRIIAVVAGDVSYVGTADGSRYFVGAVLPGGSRIVSIQSRDVGVEHDGVVSHLQF